MRGGRTLPAIAPQVGRKLGVLADDEIDGGRH